MPGISDPQPISLLAALGSFTNAPVGRAQAIPATPRRQRSQSDAREDSRQEEDPRRPRLPAGAIPSQTKLLDLFV